MIRYITSEIASRDAVPRFYNNNLEMYLTPPSRDGRPSEISRFDLGRSSRSLYAGYKSRDAHPRFSGIIISRCVFVHLEMKTHLGTPSRDFKTHVMLYLHHLKRKELFQ